MGFISDSGIASAGPIAGWARSAAKVAGAGLALALLTGMTAAGRVEVSIERLRSDNGLIQACLTRLAEHFPDCDSDPAAIRRTARIGGALRFDNLPSGAYALSLIHDENSNDRLDTFVGIPREGIGFSRNPRFSFGPPDFGAAEFAVGGAGESQTVRMRYFF